MDFSLGCILLRIWYYLRPVLVAMVADQLLDQNVMAADELRDQITLAPEKLPVPNPAPSACSTNNCLRGLAQVSPYHLGYCV